MPALIVLLVALVLASVLPETASAQGRRPARPDAPAAVERSCDPASAALALVAGDGERIDVPPCAVEASPGLDADARPATNFVLNREYARMFGDLTARNIGKVIELRVCEVVLTAPVVVSVIPSGHGQITGNWTIQETVDLSNRINSGECPGQDGEVG